MAQDIRGKPFLTRFFNEVLRRVIIPKHKFDYENYKRLNNKGDTKNG